MIFGNGCLVTTFLLRSRAEPAYDVPRPSAAAAASLDKMRVPGRIISSSSIYVHTHNINRVEWSLCYGARPATHVKFALLAVITSPVLRRVLAGWLLPAPPSTLGWAVLEGLAGSHVPFRTSLEVRSGQRTARLV